MPGSANRPEMTEARSTFFMAVPFMVEKTNDALTAHGMPGFFSMIISMLKFVVHQAGASTPQGGALNPAFCTVAVPDRVIARRYRQGGGFCWGRVCRSAGFRCPTIEF